MVLAVSGKIDHYLSEFERFEKAAEGTKPVWLDDLRQRAIVRFEQLGFPTPKNEDWRFTNISPLLKHSFRFALEAPTNTVEIPFRIPHSATTLVFCNGVYSAAESSPNHLPKGAMVTNLAAAVLLQPRLIEPYLGRLISAEDAFSALNTAFLHDGAFVYIPDGTVLENPLHLIFVTAATAYPPMQHPRNLFVFGKNVSATVIETYVADSADVYFTNAATEVFVGEASHVRHYKLQQEGEKSFHIATTTARQERNSNYASIALTIGAQLTRNNSNVVLDGAGAECSLDGLYLLHGKQHADNQTAIDHAQPHCTSQELYKGVLSGHSAGVFNGKIVVRKDAQKTNARQTNKNLLLSEGTHVNTKPQLEIRADDVKCTHGATIGQLETEPLFYMKSRGIDDHTARRLLTYGFANEVIDGVRPESLRQLFDEIIMQRLEDQTAEKDVAAPDRKGAIQMSEGRPQ
jgi:Fe-S cluster assembly protein SufD